MFTVHFFSDAPDRSPITCCTAHVTDVDFATEYAYALCSAEAQSDPAISGFFLGDADGQVCRIVRLDGAAADREALYAASSEPVATPALATGPNPVDINPADEGLAPAADAVRTGRSLSAASVALGTIVVIPWVLVTRLVRANRLAPRDVARHAGRMFGRATKLVAWAGWLAVRAALRALLAVSATAIGLRRSRRRAVVAEIRRTQQATHRPVPKLVGSIVPLVSVVRSALGKHALPAVWRAAKSARLVPMSEARRPTVPTGGGGVLAHPTPSPQSVAAARLGLRPSYARTMRSRRSPRFDPDLCALAAVAVLAVLVGSPLYSIYSTARALSVAERAIPAVKSGSIALGEGRSVGGAEKGMVRNALAAVSRPTDGAIDFRRLVRHIRLVAPNEIQVVLDDVDRSGPRSAMVFKTSNLFTWRLAALRLAEVAGDPSEALAR